MATRRRITPRAMTVTRIRIGMDVTSGIRWSRVEGMRTVINKIKGTIQGLYT